MAGRVMTLVWMAEVTRLESGGAAANVWHFA